MLIDIPTFQKRIKEKIIHALNIPREKFTLGDPQSHGSIIVQTLNIISLSTTPTVEDSQFRLNLANHYAPEKRKNGGLIEGVPYLCIHQSLTKRTGLISNSTYPVLEGPLTEIINYVSTETKHSAASIQLHTDDQGVNQSSLPLPFAAINVQIPWHEDNEPLLNLPSPKETLEMCDKLTQSINSQITLLIAGPKNDADEFFRYISKNAGTLHNRHMIHAGHITVNQAYITNATYPSKSQLELYQLCKDLKGSEQDLSERVQRALCQTALYIEALQYLSSNRNTNPNVNGIGTSPLQLEANFDKLGLDLRKNCSSWTWKGQLPLAILNERTKLVQREDSFDRLLKKYVDNGIKDPQVLNELALELKTIISSWWSLCQKVITAFEATQQGFKSHPWKLYVCHFRNKFSCHSYVHGSWNKPNWEPFSISTDVWNAQSTHTLDSILDRSQIEDTHLGRATFSDIKGDSPRAIVYPRIKFKALPNPSNFSALPKGLSQQGALAALNSPTAPAPLKIDIRLNPRPDPSTEVILECDNLQIELFNPVSSRPTGLKDATLWRPIFTRKGLPYIEDTLKMFGYQLETTAQVHNYVEKKVKQADKFRAPNYPLTPYESLAYYEQGPKIASATIMHPETNKPLWIKGRTYNITPSWQRQSMLVDHSVEEEVTNEDLSAEMEQAEALDILTIGKSSSASSIGNGDRIKKLTERHINYGFSTFITEAEDNQTFEIKEVVSRDNLSLEKERIALEIDYVRTRIEELTGKEKPTKVEVKEINTLTTQLEKKEQELDSWAPTIEDFMEAFPPETPPLSSEIHHTQISQATKTIYNRFAHCLKENESDSQTSIKDYQLQWAALGAVKRSHCNSSPPGAGKTLMAIMAAWHMGHHYNWVICPTSALKTWAKELDRVGLHNEIIGYKKNSNGAWTRRPNVYEHLRAVTARFHQRQRTPNPLGKIEPEFYIVSAESVALGGSGNRTYSPWHYDYVIARSKQWTEAIDKKKITLPPHWEMWETELGTTVRVWSDKMDNSIDIAKYGFKAYLKPMKFRKAVTECPRCKSNGPTWTRTGYCKNCKHSHSAITKIKSKWDAEAHTTEVKLNFLHMSARPKPHSKWEGDKTSHKQFPLYKLMGKHVGCKIIDEAHTWANFNTQHGAALLQVKSKDTIILSGTLCKTHINELEPSLCQIYEANSGEFPYSPWGMDMFREQFETREIENTFTTNQRQETTQTIRRNTTKVVPEASNLTKLRSLLHGVLCSVGEHEMERVWNISPIRESIRYVELQQRNAEIYNNWERLLKEAYSDCKTEHEKISMIRNSKSQITNLAYACDGPEKLEAAVAWILEGMREGKRNVIVGPSTRFHKMLCQTLKEQNIPFASMGSLTPEKRFEFLDKFRDSDCPNFVSRIRLVNVNFNQLTCCSRILFTGIDPSPAALRQMQKRLNRIGQKQQVHCTFLISQLPPTPTTPLRTLAPIDVLESLQDINQINAPSHSFLQTPSSPEGVQRPTSYEERLFALVLRREDAIKQTLQQADKQRDPQELYELLKDRQTLNQIVRDIVENAKSDDKVSLVIQNMVETPKSIPKNGAESNPPESGPTSCEEQPAHTEMPTHFGGSLKDEPEFPNKPPKKGRKKGAFPSIKKDIKNSASTQNSAPLVTPTPSDKTAPLAHAPSSTYTWVKCSPSKKTTQGYLFTL